MSDLQIRGPLWGATGAPVPFTAMFSGSQRVSDSHGRFLDAALGGRLFSIGSGATALSANTVSLASTGTPIVGLYNPIGSNVNVSILQIAAQVYINTLTTPVGCGPLVIACGITTVAITTGSTPINRKTLGSGGSAVKGFPGGVALTGLTPNLTICEGSDIAAMPVITHGTVTAVTTQYTSGGVQNFDGSLIIPPGGVIALLNTTSTTNVSVASRMLWEEIPILT